MANLVMFAAARHAAGRGHDDVSGTTLGAVLDHAVARYGDAFADVLSFSRIWVNGEQADSHDVAVTRDDEIAILPPISGG